MADPTYQNPTFGIIKTKTNSEDNTATKIGVQNDDGTINWILKSSIVPDNYSNIVYVNTSNPNSATIFDLNNPPVTNDDELKEDVTNLYIASDASTWVYKTTSDVYVTKIISSISNFFIAGTTTDAGGNKTVAIERTGTVAGSPATSSNQFVTKAQHDLKGDMTTNTAQTVTGVKTFLDVDVQINSNTPAKVLSFTHGSDTVNAGIVRFMKSRGNLNSPLAVAIGDFLGGINFSAYISGFTSNRSYLGAIMTSLSGISQYFVTGNSNTNSIPTLLIHENGNVGVGAIGGDLTSTLTAPNAKLHVKSAGTTTGNALLIQNSAGTDLVTVKDTGVTTFNNRVTGANATVSTEFPTFGQVQIKDSQIEVGASGDVQTAWDGQTIIFNTSCTITVPATLPNSFTFNAVTLAGVTVTWAITAPFTWLFGTPTATPQMSTLNFTRRGSTNSIILLQ